MHSEIEIHYEHKKLWNAKLWNALITVISLALLHLSPPSPPKIAEHPANDALGPLSLTQAAPQLQGDSSAGLKRVGVPRI